jgi:hypothetical protein
VSIRMPEAVMREVERILRDVVERHTERRLKTPDLLARLRIDHRFPVPAYTASPVLVPPSAPETSPAAADGPVPGTAPASPGAGPVPAAEAQHDEEPGTATTMRGEIPTAAGVPGAQSD